MRQTDYKPRIVTDNKHEICGALDYEVLIKYVYKCKRWEHGCDADKFRAIFLSAKSEDMKFALGKVCAFLKVALEDLAQDNPNLEDEIRECKDYLACADNDVEYIYDCMDKMFGVIETISPNVNYYAIMHEQYGIANF